MSVARRKPIIEKSGAQSLPKRRRSQAERRELTKQKLVEGAVELLKKKRYAGFRVAHVANLAGVSRGAQTHHFPTREALVLEALEFVYRETQQRALQKIAQAKKAPEKLVNNLIADSKDFFWGENFYLSLDLMMVGGNEPLGVEVKKLAKQYRISVEEMWQQAFVEAGYDTTEAEDVVLLTFSMARGLGIRKLMSNEATHFPHLINLWKSMAEKMLTKPSKFQVKK